MLYAARDTLNGMTLVEMGLMSGFSLFGPDEPVNPGVNHHRGGAEHAQVVAGRPAAGLEQPPTLVEMGLMSGFSLFGKNFVNIWPILAGTWLYTKVQKQPAAGNIGIGLMATALAPIVSYIALDNGWGGPIEGVLVGLAIMMVYSPRRMPAGVSSTRPARASRMA